MPTRQQRKTETSHERAQRQLRDYHQTTATASKPEMPVQPGTALSEQMTPSLLARVLDGLASVNALDAYTLVLTTWLSQQNIPWPDGIFKRNPWSPGSGANPLPQNVELGRNAMALQVMALFSDRPDGITEDEANEAIERVLAGHGPLTPSDLAKQLLPKDYKRKPEATSKKIKAALKTAWPNRGDLVGAAQKNEMERLRVLFALLGTRFLH